MRLSCYVMILCFFFFKQKTAYEMRISDWSSDVCSSDLFGFLEPFCRLGGKAPLDARFWVPIGNKDFSSVIAALPDDVDAIYVAQIGRASCRERVCQYV